MHPFGPVQPPRLVMCDLDGTLLDREGRMSDRTRAAIGRARQAGAMVVLATGRMLRSARPHAERLGLDTPLVCYQGAWIHDPTTGEDWLHEVMPEAGTRAAISWCREQGVAVNGYVRDQLYIERVSAESELYCRIAGVEARVSDPLEACLTHPATKLVAIAEPGTIDRLMPIALERFGAELYVTRSIPEFLEFANPNISKGRALHELARRLDIPRQAIVAFGDGLNDLEMLREAGWGVAMGQAPLALREAADEVTAPVEADGVAAVLERLFA
jgi:Cof subfamily protein (haloacid dehalogenase superfamily)